MIEDNPRIGYRTVAHLLGFNKNTVQQVIQLRWLTGAEAPGRVSAADRGAAFAGVCKPPAIPSLPCLRLTPASTDAATAHRSDSAAESAVG